jgi:hypothetical protein
MDSISSADSFGDDNSISSADSFGDEEDDILKSVDGCKEVSRHLIISCLDHHIPKLSTMKGIISCAKPLSMDNSNHAQQIILELFPE